ncbi:MAG: phosphoribosyl-AMP cyclohydrolase, partial [Arthrobacter sp.]
MSEQPTPVQTAGSAVSHVPASSVGPSPASPLPKEVAAALKRDGAGLVAAVVQQYDTNEVLMLGWMDDEALHR